MTIESLSWASEIRDYTVRLTLLLSLAAMPGLSFAANQACVKGKSITYSMGGYQEPFRNQSGYACTASYPACEMKLTAWNVAPEIGGTYFITGTFTYTGEECSNS